MRFIVCFDYTWAYRNTTAVWLRRVVTLERTFTIEWQPYILRESNLAPVEDLPFWKQPGRIRRHHRCCELIAMMLRASEHNQ